MLFFIHSKIPDKCLSEHFAKSCCQEPRASTDGSTLAAVTRSPRPHAQASLGPLHRCWKHTLRPLNAEPEMNQETTTTERKRAPTEPNVWHYPAAPLSKRMESGFHKWFWKADMARNPTLQLALPVNNGWSLSHLGHKQDGAAARLPGGAPGDREARCEDKPCPQHRQVLSSASLARPAGHCHAVSPTSTPAPGGLRKRDCSEPSSAGSSALGGPVRTAPGPESRLLPPWDVQGPSPWIHRHFLKVHKMGFLEQQ